MSRIYTRTGDDGTTGLLYGGRVPKDHPAPAACGDVDEAQSAIGLARALAAATGTRAPRDASDGPAGNAGAPGGASGGPAGDAAVPGGVPSGASDGGGGREELGELLVRLERDLWVLMAELATAAENRPKLAPGRTLVTAEMVSALEPLIDDVTARFPAPREFVLPGQTPLSAALDLARAVVRRAERTALSAAADGSHVVPYLNRLSDLLWALARWQEGEPLPARPSTTTTTED